MGEKGICVLTLSAPCVSVDESNSNDTEGVKPYQVERSWILDVHVHCRLYTHNICHMIS